MAYGLHPFLAEQRPYQGAAYRPWWRAFPSWWPPAASPKRPISPSRNTSSAWATDPTRWGKPMASLLGALDAQVELGAAAIGGKDSMSGSFENIDVPPTLVSFAVAAGNTDNVVSPEFKLPGSKLVLLSPAMRDGRLPTAGSLKLLWAQVETLIKENEVLSACTPCHGRSGRGTVEDGPGQPPGSALCGGLDAARTCSATPTAALCWSWRRTSTWARPSARPQPAMCGNWTARQPDLAKSCRKPMRHSWSRCCPTVRQRQPGRRRRRPLLKYEALNRVAPKVGTAKPRVLIPVFPGTNCEYDSARAMERAGAEPEVFVINNLTPAHVAESVAAVKELIGRSQMIFLPGGFSGGDEPEGSAKFIAAFFRNPAITEAVRGLLQTARRPDAGHLQRLPGADQAGPGALRRYRGDG